MRPAHAHLQFRFLAALLLGVLLAACRSERTIQPQLPTPDPALGGAIIYDQPLLVTFSGLNDDAAVNGVNTEFRNQLVRVSGAYAAVTPEACGGQPTNGPHVSWSLVAENLRLDAVGLEQVLALAPEGTQFTIEGVWRVYEGPLGCGKEPAWGVRFYLQAQRIVEPNPLPFVVAGTLDESGAPGGRPAPDGGPETLPADGSPSDGGTAAGTPPPAGADDGGGAGGTPTVVGTRPTATVVPLATTPTSGSDPDSHGDAYHPAHGDTHTRQWDAPRADADTHADQHAAARRNQYTVCLPHADSDPAGNAAADQYARRLPGPDAYR